MKVMPSLVGLIAGFILFGCHRAEDTRPTREARQAFTIDLPAGCSMVGGTRRLDFAILQVNCASVPQIGIYAGNAPNIDQDDEGLAPRSDIPGRSVVVGVKDPDEKVRGYVLETPYRWPSRLHVWIDKGRENDPMARRIAASVQATQP